MADLQAAVRAPWRDTTDAQAALQVTWRDADTVQSVGSPYVRPPSTGLTPTALGSLAPARDIAPATSYVVSLPLQVLDLRDDSALPVDSVQVAFTDGSVFWTLEARGSAALAARMQAGEQPPTVEVRIGVDVWRFVVEQVDQPQTFGSAAVTLRGRSLAALAGAPYQAEQAWIADAPTTAAQISTIAQTYTGLEIDWRLEDWLIPAGEWSVSGDPLAVVRAIAQAVGADVEAHRSEMRLLIRPRYPAMPNTWATIPPDWQVPWAVVESAQSERADQPDYDAVVVAGSRAGDVLIARLAGTAGGRQAPMVADPMLVDLPALQQRAVAMLGSYGQQTRETRSLQVHGNVLDRGMLARFVEPAATWAGMVRGVRVAADLGKVRQALTMERHTAFAAGSALPDPIPEPPPPSVITEIFFGEHLTPGGTVSGPPKTERDRFMAAVANPATLTFEAMPTSGDVTQIVANFPAPHASLQATFVAAGRGNDPDTPGIRISTWAGSGRYNTTPSGAKYLDIANALQITLSAPVEALGFYGTDWGDFNGRVKVTFTDELGAEETFDIPHSSPGTNASLIFWGFIATGRKYTQVLFKCNYDNPSDGANESKWDYFGLDDLIVGVRA